MESMFHQIIKRNNGKRKRQPQQHQHQQNQVKSENSSLKSCIKYELVFKMMVLVASFVVFIQEALELVKLYYKYPTVVNVKLEKEMIIDLPSVTLCFPVFLSKSSILSKYRKQITKDIDIIEKSIEIGVKSGKSIENETIEFKKNQIFEKYRDLAMKEIKIVDLFNLSISESKFISCDLTLPPLFPSNHGDHGFHHHHTGCDRVSDVIESFNANGKCFTYFSQLNQLRIDPLQYKVSLYQGLRSSIGGIATININFPLEEYINYWDIDMAIIYIHPPNLVPSFEKIHKLKPGKYHFYYL